MKKSFFILPLLAAWALTGCSSDEPAGNDGGQDESVEKSYLAVNIVSPRTQFGKGQDGGFEDNPSEKENAAKTAMFLFFDEDGNSTQSPQIVDLNWTSNTATETPAIEKISSAVLVIAGSTEPVQMLVVLNPPTSAYANSNGKTLGWMHSLFSEKYGINSDSTFIMTNSTYVATVDGSKAPVSAVKVAGKAKKTAEEAAADPVNVYVERTVAKLAVSAVPEYKKGSTTEPFAANTKVKIDNVEYTLKPVIKAMEIANVGFSTYLYKSLGNNYTNWPEYLLDENNYRSYWATCPTNLTMVNRSYNAVTDSKDAGHNYYVFENTTGNKTSVLLTAQLVNAEDDKPISFLYWGGSYYMKDGKNPDGTDNGGFLNQYALILKNANFRIATTTGGSTEGVTTAPSDAWRDITVSDLRWITEEDHRTYTTTAFGAEYKLEDFEMTAKVISAVDLGVTGRYYEYLNPTTNEWEQVEPAFINNFLRLKRNRVWIWNEGMCYYFKNIEHYGTGDYAEGIVRNHVYQLSLSSLKGLGTPVFFPDDNIIPQKPKDELFYLDAVINILKWKVVKQDVDFE